MGCKKLSYLDAERALEKSSLFVVDALEKKAPFAKRNIKAYPYGFQGQERDDEVKGSGNSIVFKYRIHDPRLGRFLSTDPLEKDFAWNSPYAFSENEVINAVEFEGLEKVYIFDQATNPNNKRKYTAKIYVVTDDEVVHGPYDGSSFPNNPNKQNTVVDGRVLDYNNKSGHKGGTKKGLNIINDKGERRAPGTSPSGNPVEMKYVNVHSGVPKEDDPAGLGRDNRGSAGCPTCTPEDSEAFFENFDFSGENGTTGNAEGTITIYRGTSEESTKMLNSLQERQSAQSAGRPAVSSDIEGEPQ